MRKRPGGRKSRRKGRNRNGSGHFIWRPVWLSYHRCAYWCVSGDWDPGRHDVYNGYGPSAAGAGVLHRSGHLYTARHSVFLRSRRFYDVRRDIQTAAKPVQRAGGAPDGRTGPCNNDHLYVFCGDFWLRTCYGVRDRFLYDPGNDGEGV